MKVFVLGATGVLGRATVPRLIEAGHGVVGVARSPEKAAALRAQGAEPVEGLDVFDPDAVAVALRDTEAVVHMATSVPPVGRGWRTKAWVAHDRLRAEGTAVLTEAAHQVGVPRFVKESVCFFYDPQADRWIDEDTPIQSSDFARATLAAEETTLAAGGVVLRFGLFYSADARSLEEGLSMARLGFGPMIGRVDAYQISIHVDDAATAVVAALGAPPGAYNVADEPITKGEWNAAFAETFGMNRRLRPTPTLVLRALGSKGAILAGSRRVSSRRFRDATGWAPRYADASIGLRAVAAEHHRRSRS